jgi:hypothetical protein
MSEAGSAGQRGEGSRARLVFAGALALVLAAAIAGVLIFVGGEAREFAVASEHCVEEWNQDPEAVSLGRHQADPPPSGHGYLRVQVTTLDPDGGDELEATDPGVVCALIFASPMLSSEAASAVLVRVDDVWQPLAGLGPPLDRLATLQQQAESAYNARLEVDGTVTPLE